jgi:hypothetical protein
MSIGQIEYIVSGAQTLPEFTGASVVRLSASSATDVYGMSSGFGDVPFGRIKFLLNTGTANLVLYHDSSSASRQSDRFAIDGYGSSLTLAPNGAGGAIAVYDGITLSGGLGWRLIPIPSSASILKNITGTLSATTTGSFAGTLAAGNSTLSGTGSTTRLALKSTTSGNNSSIVRWKNPGSVNQWSMANDWAGNGGLNWYLRDDASSMYNLYFDDTRTSVSYLNFGTSGSGMRYNESIYGIGSVHHDLLSFYIANSPRLELHTFGFFVETPTYYQRRSASTPLPTLGANCGGTLNVNSSDLRGAVTIGAGSSACTLTFAVPFNLGGANTGTPICTATSSTLGRKIAITAISPSLVTFTLNATGTTTIYYHCDGILSPSI